MNRTHSTQLDKRHNSSPAYGRQSGFSLTEVLIAVVILSIGLLGIAGIQIKGLRGTHSATLRGQATILANDMAERIRANPAGVSLPAGAGGVPTLPTNDSYADVSSAVANYCDQNTPQCINNSATPCTTRAMAQYDIKTWLCGNTNNDGLRNLLPTGSASISCTDSDITDADNCSPGSTLNVVVGWGESDPANGAALNKTVQLLVVP